MRLAGPAPSQLALGLGPSRSPLPVLDQRARGATFLGLESRSLLNSPATTGMAFWTLNPYVGCELGCCYCYARNAHRWTAERSGAPVPDDLTAAEAFERAIFVKRDAARVVRRTLDPAKLDGFPLLIGTATDPYQPAERRFKVTRAVLEVLAEYRGLEIWITTKSPLVARDLDVLQSLSARHRVSICISLITLDALLVRRLEPRSPLPHARLRGLTALAEGGVTAGVLIAPILPKLTDGWASLGSVMAAAKEAGASFAVGSALRLAPVARAGFLPVLEREYPGLVPRYRSHFGGRYGASRAYLSALDHRIKTLQAIHGFPVQSLRYG
jgi:DNA repair photolyase